MLDVVTIGRSSVDLYGTQIGGRLEDMTSFRKYIGGSPTNMAAGMARLGMKAAVITRVGDEHMGRFIREQLAREGVDVRGVKTDPERLTALVLLGIRDDLQFPLIFYRENCADMALSEDDIDPGLIKEAAAVVATGTHLSHPRTEAAVIKALTLGRDTGARTALDIDYRPNLWGLSGHDDGENRFIASDKVSRQLQATLALFDLIVGTEEEFYIAGGSTDLVTALRNVRAVSDATLICKRGATGAVAFVDHIPGNLDDGIAGPGFPIEVFNVLGAGDGFMAGLMKGWMSGQDWPISLKYANACGALAVSRHGCAPAYPSWEELQFFFERGITNPALRKDIALNHVHWATNRRGDWPELKVFAFDHRAQLETMAEEAGASQEQIRRFKDLCLKAALSVADGRPGYGVLCDGRLGQNALFQAAGTGLWIGRPVETPGSRPLTLEIGPDLGSALGEWPVDHVVKVLCYYHGDDDDPTKADQEAVLLRLADAARANGLELLVELVPSSVGPVTDQTTAIVMRRLYEIGLRPDWWKLEAQQSQNAWSAVSATIDAFDPWCRGVLLLGLEASEADLIEGFGAAAKQKHVKG
ncbi:MAG: bifunctional 5-dehydro-2-deoxygluconokinase/5-dehydro-2-deoxyphosphogluconate aldolase, partial [Geminicoccaceae bacterium]